MREKARKQSSAEKLQAKAAADRAYDALCKLEMDFQFGKAQLQNQAQLRRWDPAKYRTELQRCFITWPYSYQRRIPHIVASHATWLKATEPSQPFAPDTAWLDGWLDRMTAKQEQP